jgi:hypothetical protein
MISFNIIIDLSKKRFSDLSEKGFEWRSFYNGFLEGYTSVFPELEKCYAEIADKESIIEGLKCEHDKGVGMNSGLELYHELIEKANELGLSSFVFKYCGDTFVARFNGLSWEEPVIIRELSK